MADCFSSKTLRRINKELNSLRSDPPEGIRVVINEDDITDLRAWILGPAETPYQNGYFKITIRFGPEYPSAPPNCTFATKIFHPNVGPKGEICVNTLKKDWTPNQTLTDILTVVKCLLIYPNPESALDEEAGRLLLENYEEYRQRAKLWTNIHAKTKPAGLFDCTSSESTIPNGSANAAPMTITDSKQTALPFATLNQGNHNQNIQALVTVGESNLNHQGSNENLIKPNNNTNHLILNPTTNHIEGENIIPSSMENPKITPNLINNHKDKDRRGRRRL